MKRKQKALISCVVTEQLICVFVFAYAKIRFSHDANHNILSYFREGSKPPSFWMKACIGLAAGACGAFVGTPAEISLIRMTADGR